MTEIKSTTTSEHDAKAMLQEALDTIKATYWIQNTEFSFAESQRQWDEEKGTTIIKWDDWDTINKAILVDLGEMYNDGDEQPSRRYANPEADNKAKVTGVCSIGALTLAETTLYDIPLQPFEQRAQWDFPLWLTGVALAKSIWNREDEEFYSEHGGPEWASVIATWNDRSDTDRDDVIDAFTTALEDPLLTMPKGQVPVEVGYTGTWGSNRTGWVFATREEAEAWLSVEENKGLLDIRYGGSQTYKITDVEHEALQSA